MEPDGSPLGSREDRRLVVSVSVQIRTSAGEVNPVLTNKSLEGRAVVRAMKPNPVPSVSRPVNWYELPFAAPAVAVAPNGWSL